MLFLTLLFLNFVLFQVQARFCSQSSETSALKQFYDEKLFLQLFEDFVKKYNKKYKSDVEYDRRFNIFKKNVEYINKKNADNSSSALFGITEFTDRAIGEKRLKKNHCLNYLPKDQEEKDNFTDLLRREEIPTNWDWREAGFGGIVEEQNDCGSCWAFAIASIVESQYYIKYKKKLHLSKQQLIDCSGGRNNCLGGFPEEALNDLARETGGLMTEEDYPYIGTESGQCKAREAKVVARILGAHLVYVPSEEHLKHLIYRRGPVITGLSLGNDAAYYLGGVAMGRDLGCIPGEALNHAVAIMGYGEKDEEKWWLIKNSHGKNWGENGYLRLARSVSDIPECGVAEYIVEVELPEEPSTRTVLNRK